MQFEFWLFCLGDGFGYIFKKLRNFFSKVLVTLLKSDDVRFEFFLSWWLFWLHLKKVGHFFSKLLVTLLNSYDVQFEFWLLCLRDFLATFKIVGQFFLQTSGHPAEIWRCRIWILAFFVLMTLLATFKKSWAIYSQNFWSPCWNLIM